MKVNLNFRCFGFVFMFFSISWVGLDMPLVVRCEDSVNDLWSVTSTLAKRTKLNSWVKTAALVFTSFWQDYIVFNVDAAWKVGKDWELER